MDASSLKRRTSERKGTGASTRSGNKVKPPGQTEPKVWPVWVGTYLFLFVLREEGGDGLSGGPKDLRPHRPVPRGHELQERTGTGTKVHQNPKPGLCSWMFCEVSSFQAETFSAPSFKTEMS